MQSIGNQIRSGRSITTRAITELASGEYLRIDTHNLSVLSRLGVQYQIYRAVAAGALREEVNYTAVQTMPTEIGLPAACVATEISHRRS
jgi:hypothetical protein